MCYPCIQLVVAEEVQVCADHVGLCICSFFVCYDAVEEASIVVAEGVVAPVRVSVPGQGGINADSDVPRFVEVFERIFFCMVRHHNIFRIPCFPMRVHWCERWRGHRGREERGGSNQGRTY